MGVASAPSARPARESYRSSPATETVDASQSRHDGPSRDSHMSRVTVGDYELNCVEKGDGPPLVLIHGLAGDLSAWAPQLEAWSSRYRVIAFDNRGAGQSTQVDEPISTEDMAHDTLMLMDELGIDNACIVGRSMGGAIAQHIALRAPDRVRALVLCASFAKLDPVGER